MKLSNIGTLNGRVDSIIDVDSIGIGRLDIQIADVTYAVWTTGARPGINPGLREAYSTAMESAGYTSDYVATHLSLIEEPQRVFFGLLPGENVISSARRVEDSIHFTFATEIIRQVANAYVSTQNVLNGGITANYEIVDAAMTHAGFTRTNNGGFSVLMNSVDYYYAGELGHPYGLKTIQFVSSNYYKVDGRPRQDVYIYLDRTQTGVPAIFNQLAEILKKGVQTVEPNNHYVEVVNNGHEPVTATNGLLARKAGLASMLGVALNQLIPVPGCVGAFTITPWTYTLQTNKAVREWLVQLDFGDVVTSEEVLERSEAASTVTVPVCQVRGQTISHRIDLHPLADTIRSETSDDAVRLVTFLDEHPLMGVTKTTFDRVIPGTEVFKGTKLYRLAVDNGIDILSQVIGKDSDGQDVTIRKQDNKAKQYLGRRSLFYYSPMSMNFMSDSELFATRWTLDREAILVGIRPDYSTEVYNLAGLSYDSDDDPGYKLFSDLILYNIPIVGDATQINDLCYSLLGTSAVNFKATYRDDLDITDDMMHIQLEEVLVGGTFLNVLDTSDRFLRALFAISTQDAQQFSSYVQGQIDFIHSNYGILSDN